MPLRHLPVALVASFVLLGCASGGTGSAATRPLPVIHVTEQQNGGKVTLRRGERLRVVLHSTYWEFKAVSAPAVLRRIGDPLVSPRSGCMAGQGCGTVTATYIARTSGSASVTAERTSCGEAMGCTAAAGAFTLTVSVRGAAH